MYGFLLAVLVLDGLFLATVILLRRVRVADSQRLAAAAGPWPMAF